ncbi:MAG: winged helix-turn-helix transcriptional regulator [Spirochaetia bacterium]|nr:winged helix-turn-helix transcriptional regulator [Spirochaetia bacterium]
MESITIEYKRELTDGFEKEVVAFLNTLGGSLFIGLDDDGTIIGVQNPDKLSLAIIDRIKTNIQPSPLGLFNVEVKQETDTSYILIIVAQGLEKPYFLKKYGMSTKGCYTRIGSQSCPMTQTMVTELFSRRVTHTLSRVVSPNQHLTFTQLKIYYADKGFDTSNEFFLKNLGLYTEDDRFNYAAYLMSDNNGNSIKVARFKGTEKLDILERNEFGRCCLIKSAYQVLDKLEVANATVVRVGGQAARKEIKLVDKDALREAVLNAIIHNDYINGSYPVFELYDDRLVVVSTGGLPIGLTKDEFFKGLSHPRNRELMRIFSDMDLCEQLGSGMKKILKAYPKAVFDISDHFISVNFQYNKEAMDILSNNIYGGVNGGEAKLSENAIRVLKAIKGNEKLTQAQIADDLQMPIRTMQRALKELKEKQYIQREGSAKSGQYIILKPFI